MQSIPIEDIDSYYTCSNTFNLAIISPHIHMGKTIQRDMYSLDKVEFLSNLQQPKIFKPCVEINSQGYFNGVIEFSIGRERCAIVSSPHVGLAIWWEESMRNDVQYLLLLSYWPRYSNVIQKNAKYVLNIPCVKPHARNSSYHLHIKISRI